MTTSALCAVLSHKIEIVKTSDGIERRLGFRLLGTIFGELRIALGTPGWARSNALPRPSAREAWLLLQFLGNDGHADEALL